MNKPLPPKHEQFANEYIIDKNSTQAAIRAGYAAACAHVTGPRLIANARIQQRIAELSTAKGERVQFTADHVFAELVSIATDDISNYLEYNSAVKLEFNPITEQDEPVGFTNIILKDSKTINTKNIQEISIGKDGTFKFKLYPRDKALIECGRHLGMFKDKLEINDVTIPDLSTLTGPEKMQYLLLQKKLRKG